MGKNTYKRVVDLLNEHIPAKISRNEFSRITGINRNSIDRYRVGLGTPIHETLEKLAAYFDVSVAWLRGDTDEKRTEINRLPALKIEFLKKVIAEKGLEAVSKETGLGPDTIDSYLTGVSEPSTKTLKKLADYLGVSIWELRGNFDLNEFDFCKRTETEISNTAKNDTEFISILRELENTIAKMIYDEKRRYPHATKEQLGAHAQKFLNEIKEILTEGNKELEEILAKSSDTPENKQIVDSENLKSQLYLSGMSTIVVDDSSKNDPSPARGQSSNAINENKPVNSRRKRRKNTNN